jgi:hypothetical protein
MSATKFGRGCAQEQEQRVSIKSLPCMSFASLVAFFASAVHASGATHDLVQKARISVSQARHIAQQAYAGKIMKEELEREGGGLRYSFDMRRGKHWREVGVDAITGKVLENTAEPPGPKTDNELCWIRLRDNSLREEKSQDHYRFV